MIAAFAGSFDPPTRGHYDIIERASGLFERVVVLVSPNSLKNGMFDAARRVAWLERMCADFDNVEVALCPGLTVSAARAHGAGVLLRSMRSGADLDGEFNNAWVNAQLTDGMETLFLSARPENLYISSSNVRELLRYGQSVAHLVCPCILEDLQPGGNHGEQL